MQICKIGHTKDQKNNIWDGAEEKPSRESNPELANMLPSSSSQSVGLWKPAWSCVPFTPPSLLPPPLSCWCMLLTARSRADEGLVRFMFSWSERGTAHTDVCEKGLGGIKFYLTGMFGFLGRKHKKDLITVPLASQSAVINVLAQNYLTSALFFFYC